MVEQQQQVLTIAAHALGSYTEVAVKCGNALMAEKFAELAVVCQAMRERLDVDLLAE